VSDDAVRGSATFIVRASRDARGRLRGIVERVKTGEKQRFTSAEVLGGVIDTMLGTRRPWHQSRPRSSSSSPSPEARSPRAR
jgi:hypothetical protein